MRRYIVECKGCKKPFSKIRGLKHHDFNCCSERCFVSEPRKQVVIEPSQGLNFNKFRSQYKKRNNKKSKQKNRHKKEDFYLSKEWLQIRYEVIKKYGRECMACGTTHGEMHVDHIKPRSRYPSLQLEFSNLQVLCRDCNKGKSNRDSTDFRLTIRE